jgi:hypothetical protein
MMAILRVVDSFFIFGSFHRHRCDSKTNLATPEKRQRDRNERSREFRGESAEWPLRTQVRKALIASRKVEIGHITADANGRQSHFFVMIFRRARPPREGLRHRERDVIAAGIRAASAVRPISKST